MEVLVLALTITIAALAYLLWKSKKEEASVVEGSFRYKQQATNELILCQKVVEKILESLAREIISQFPEQQLTVNKLETKRGAVIRIARRGMASFTCQIGIDWAPGAHLPIEIQFVERKPLRMHIAQSDEYLREIKRFFYERQLKITSEAKASV